MIKLIVGLGNPGHEYEKTRHNVGFLFLDHLTGGANEWSVESKFSGVVSSYKNTIKLIKPATFMNKSGMSVLKITKFYKIEPTEILVVHDELDFQIGVAKLKFGGGHAGHNGIRDIMINLGTNEFYRLRIGIGRPSVNGDVAQYVLSDFSKKDEKNILGVFSVLDNYMDSIVEDGINSVMNELNRKL